jgi:hypothetical protein
LWTGLVGKLGLFGDIYVEALMLAQRGGGADAVLVGMGRNPLQKNNPTPVRIDEHNQKYIRYCIPLQSET